MIGIEVAIVGAGPRALNVIERLSWRLKQSPSLPRIVVHLIDPGVPCAGAHPPDQSHYLLTNTLASQVTMFSSVEPADPLSGPSGPSFTDWVIGAGYRRFGADYRKASSNEGEPIGELDYLPRALLGQYLAFSHDRILKDAPAALNVIHHRDVAMDICVDASAVVLKGGGLIPFDALVIATGHCETLPSDEDHERDAFVAKHQARNPKLAYVRTVYPTSVLNTIARGATVAVQGLGLTSYDVIAELTLGRGGRFEGPPNALRYIPSGAEPRVLLFSRQSLPYDARGINQKGVDGGHKARFLTAAAVEEIRRQRRLTSGDGRIDFIADIMPLLRKEMAFGMRCARLGREIDAADFEATASEDDAIERIIDPRHLLEAYDLEQFRDGVIRHLRADLAEAFMGNVNSRLKAATDTIRDLRAGLAAAIEFRGLRPDSHRFVVEQFIAVTNRITFGPPLRRNAELLALIDAGVVDWAGGPGATVAFRDETARFVIQTPFSGGTSFVEADALVIARITGHRPDHDAQPLSRNMISRGWARAFRNGDYEPYGLDVDPRMRLLSPDGRPNPRAWALGYVIEGPRFHTHALPRPKRASTQLADAATLVDDLLASMIKRDIPKGRFAVRSVNEAAL